MLAQQSTDTPASEPTTVAPAALSATEDVQAKALKAIVDLAASPEFQSLGDHFPQDFTMSFGEDPLITDDAPLFGNDAPLFGDASPFLTSPHESTLDDFGTSPLDTPYSEFMPTPLLTMDDMFESPVITDRAYADDDSALTGALFGFPFDSDTPDAAPKLPPPPAADKLWTISPGTPALDSIDAPAKTSTRPTAPSPARRRTAVTGTRKNITPGALIPIDAPTQKRKYVTPSATSRKAVPAGFARKRGHSAAFGDDVADEELGELSPTASEQEQIEYKRRQNTLAARKSRKRKLEHQQMLESTVDDLKREVTMWRERALMAQEMLRGAGIKFNVEAMDVGEA